MGSFVFGGARASRRFRVLRSALARLAIVCGELAPFEHRTDVLRVTVGHPDDFSADGHEPTLRYLLIFEPLPVAS